MSNTLYDLISINNHVVPDVSKGTITIAPNPKYNEYEGELGNKVIDIIREDMLKGSVEYSGLLQSDVQNAYAAIDLVSTMTVYSPFTGTTKTFMAKVIIGDSNKIVYDEQANAWTFTFEFEEIDSVT